MSENITIYEKPTCTTCRKTVKILEEKGVDFDKINYYIEPFTREKLVELIQMMQIEPEALLRKNAPEYKDLDLKNKELDHEDCIDLLVKYPDLVQRPIVVRGNKAVLARPAEKINELF